MKNKFFKVFALSATVFVLGAVALSKINKNVDVVFAVQHESNYSEYTYSGSYYDSIDNNSLIGGLNGTLKSALATLAKPKAYYTYSGSQSGQLGKVLQDADEDPTNSSNMVMFYTRDSVSKRSSGNGSGNWNREHVWPQSLSNGHWGKTEGGTDILHIRPTWYDTNETRGNTVYGDNNKRGSVSYSGMTYAYTSGGYFEPLDSVKGDVARILMYVYTVYSVYYNDSSLYITKVIESYDVLLKWHMMDRPDALEGHRNDYAETSKQKNRNPFVDHPEYAWKVFGNNASSSVYEACKAAYPETGSVTPPPSSSSMLSSSEQPSSSVASSSSEQISSSEEISSSEQISSSSEEQSSAAVISSIEEQSSYSEQSTGQFSSEIINISSEDYYCNGDVCSKIISSNPETTSSNNEGENKKSSGCGGSVVVLPLTGISALIGVVFLFSKKKRK